METEATRAGVEGRIGAALAGWVGVVGRHRWQVLALAVAASVAALLYTANHLGIESDKDALFPDDLPFRVLDARYVEAFPQLYENIVLVLEGPTAEATRRAALELEATLRADRTHFLDVYQPENSYFETQGLLFLEEDELDALADRLAEVQPILSALVADTSVRGLAGQMETTLAALRKGDIEGVDLVPMLERISRATSGSLTGDEFVVEWSEIVGWGEGRRNLRRRVLYAQPRLDYGSMAAAKTALAAVDEAVVALGLVPENGYRIRLTGDMVLNAEEMQLVRDQVSLAGLGSLFVVTGLLFIGLRSARLVVATVTSLVVGLVLTLGFAALAIGHLNMISVAFAVLFIGLGVDFGIHLCMRFQELQRGGIPTADALDETTRGVGSSLVLCGATTAIGFFAFVPTDFIGVAELGIISGVGMFISVATSFCVLPAIVAGAPDAASKSGIDEGPASRSEKPGWQMRHPTWVAALALVMALGSLSVVPRLAFDANPLGVRDPAARSVQTYEDLLSDHRHSPWTLNYLAADRAEARTMAARFEALPEVEAARILDDYVPSRQAEKLEIVGDMRLFASFIEDLDRPGVADSTATDSGDSIGPTLDALRALSSEVSRPDLGASGSEIEVTRGLLADVLTRLLERLDLESEAGRRATLAELEARLLSTFTDPLQRLARALDARPVSEADLPDGLRRRMVSNEGIHRVEIVSAENLAEAGALDAFVAAVQTVSPEVPGPALRIHDSAHAVVGALREAFAAAIVVIALILWVLWRRLDDMVLVMLPLAWAGLMTGGAMFVTGIAFNFADVIVLPLLLGIGVDSGIHMVHRHRLGASAGESLLATSTARAVVFSALTTMASFGTLAVLPHRGMASLGQLLVIGVGLTVIANLVLLPALIELRRRWRGDRVHPT